jgi:3-hydroxyisobutyrate dehydrogenase
MEDVDMEIGFIGVGYMGRHMARNLINGGHNLKIFDIRKEAANELLQLGATWADNPRQAAQDTEITFMSLPTPKDVADVALGEGGIIEGINPSSTIFDLSTTSIEIINQISDAARKKGISFLDAPVSGGTEGANKGTLCVMVGGSEEIFQKYRETLELIGDKVMYCGDIGSGSICKIVNNLIGLSVNVLLSEAFTLGVKAGISPDILFDAISKSSGNTQSMQAFPETLFKRNFEPGFQVDLAAKDVGLATDLGRIMRIPMELSNIVQQRYIDAQNQGLGRLSANAVAQIQESRSGVEIKK